MKTARLFVYSMIVGAGFAFGMAGFDAWVMWIRVWLHPVTIQALTLAF